ncbi:MAG: sulfotransferase [Thermodesulfobacteriota bacterium]
MRDIVFGRSRITVVDKSEQEKLHVRPIFLIGCFRSGTTLLRYLLDSHSLICSPPETKFLTHLSGLHKDSESMQAFGTMGFDDEYVRKRMKHFAEEFFLDYMAAKKKVRWVDKTPEYVRILDYIDWMYGEEVDYIFIYRNGLDVTQSMLLQSIAVLEPNKNMAKAFEYWFEDALTMLSWRQKLKGRCCEVFYENLCRNPSDTMNTIFDFLDVPREDVVDVWFRKRHDMGFEDIKARRQTSIKLSHGNFSAWSREELDHYKARAAEVHERLGYDPETLMPRVEVRHRENR